MNDAFNGRELLYDPMFAKKPPKGWEDSEKGGIFGKAVFKKTVFILFLVFSIGVSLFFSFRALGKEKYTYTQTADGIEFTEFNGTNKDSVLCVENVINEDDTVDESKAVTSVRNYAICCNEYIEFIFIGKDVRELEYNCFYYCTNLRAIFVDEENPNYKSVDGVLYNSDMTEIIIHPIKNHEYRTALSLGIAPPENSEDCERFMTVFTEVFGDNEEDRSENVKKELLSVGANYEIPETVTSVAPFCFNYCSGLSYIKLPSGLKSIGQMSFFKCTSLESIYLPDTLESIGADGFSYCEKITYIYVPASVKNIGHHAFFGCLGCDAIYLGAADEKQITIGEGWLPKKDVRSTKNVDAVYGQERRSN